MFPMEDLSQNFMGGSWGWSESYLKTGVNLTGNGNLGRVRSSVNGTFV